jgi:hypothetical protein
MIIVYDRCFQQVGLIQQDIGYDGGWEDNLFMLHTCKQIDTIMIEMPPLLTVICACLQGELMQLTDQLSAAIDQLPAAQMVLLARRQAAAAAAAAAGADQQRQGVYGMLKHAFRQVLARVGCSSSGQLSPGGSQTSTAGGQTISASSPNGSGSGGLAKGAWLEPWFEGLTGWQLEQQVWYVLALAEDWGGVQRLLEAAEEARVRLVLAARTGGLGSSKVEWWEAAAAAAAVGSSAEGGIAAAASGIGYGAHVERAGVLRRAFSKGLSLGWWVVRKLGVGDAATLAALEPLTAADVLLIANGGKEVIWELLTSSARQVWQQRSGQR